MKRSETMPLALSRYKLDNLADDIWESLIHEFDTGQLRIIGADAWRVVE